MAFSFDKLLGIHEQALYLRSQRAEVLSNNIANADTPGFKARDMDFRSVLQQYDNKTVTADLKTTNRQHLPGFSGSASSPASLYRTPSQPSIDGNTVDSHVEKAEYVSNSVAFQASYTFLNSRIKGIIRAIKGE